MNILNSGKIPKYLLSSDASLLQAQGLAVLPKIYGKYFKLFDGLELVGTRWIGGTLKQAQQLGLKTVCIHGRMAGIGDFERTWERPIMFLLNQSLISTEKLAKICEQNGFEALVHAPELRKPTSFQALVDYKEKLRCVWVENHPSVDKHLALTQAVSFVRKLREQGVKAKLVFDICHAIDWQNLTGPDFPQAFYQALDWLKKCCQIGSLGLHIGIGTAPRDSLPIANESLLTDEMLKDLAALIRRFKIKRVVVEYSANIFDLLIQKTGSAQVGVERLVKTGIIKAA